MYFRTIRLLARSIMKQRAKLQCWLACFPCRCSVFSWCRTSYGEALHANNTLNPRTSTKQNIEIGEHKYNLIINGAKNTCVNVYLVFKIHHFSWECCFFSIVIFGHSFAPFRNKTKYDNQQIEGIVIRDVL